MGKLLISGNGKGHSKISTLWILNIVLGGVMAGIMYFLANDLGIDAGRAGVQTMWGTTYGAREASKNEMYFFFMGLAVLSPVLMLIAACIDTRRISKTAIDVYENGIKGFAKLTQLSIYLSEFQLTYNQVASVDVVNGNKLIINSENVKHTIFAMNSRQIRDTILAQKSKVGQQGA